MGILLDNNIRYASFNWMRLINLIGIYALMSYNILLFPMTESASPLLCNIFSRQ